MATPSWSTGSPSVLSKSTRRKLGSPRCPRERELGLVAKQRLVELLAQGELTVVTVGRDRFNRALAYIYAGEVLLREGLALRGPPAPKARPQGWQRGARHDRIVALAVIVLSAIVLAAVVDVGAVATWLRSWRGR